MFSYIWTGRWTLQRGQYALIHAGGSGVATAAVQICKLLEVKAIVTAGSEEKIARAKSLGAVEGFNYKDGDFAEKVLEYTNGNITQCRFSLHF